MPKLDLDALVGTPRTPAQPKPGRRTLDLDALVGGQPAARQGAGSAPGEASKPPGPSTPIAADADLYKTLSPYVRKAQALVSFLQSKKREPPPSLREYVGDGTMDVLDSRTNRVYRTGATSFVVVPTGRKAVPQAWAGTKTDDHFDFGGSKKAVVDGTVPGNVTSGPGTKVPRLVRLSDGFFTLYANPVLLLAAMLAVRAPGRSPRILASKPKPYMKGLPILGIEGPGGLAILALVNMS